MPDLNDQKATVRQLLRAAFSDDQIMDLALDHFPEVYDDFGLGMGKGQKIRALVDTAGRTGRLADLLAYVRQHNPYQYQQYAAQLGAPALKPAQQADLAALSVRMAREFELLRAAGADTRAEREAALAATIEAFAQQSAGGAAVEAIGGDKLTLENVQGAIAVGRNATVQVNNTDPALMQQLLTTLERLAQHIEQSSGGRP